MSVWLIPKCMEAGCNKFAAVFLRWCGEHALKHFKDDITKG